MKYSLMLVAALLMLVGCNGGEKSDSRANAEWKAPVVVDTILCADVREGCDTVRIQGQLLAYAFRFAPDDSLPLVVNADGQRARDNVAELTVHRGETLLLHRVFHKQDFAAFVPQDQMPYCTLAGFTYDRMRSDERDALRFVATVGDPDESSGVNYPVELVVSPSGALRLEVGDDMETAPLVPDLREEPVR